MASAILSELRKKTDAVWANLTRQLQGMEPYIDRSDAPSQWTTRQLLAHLLADGTPARLEFLKQFSTKDLPPGEITPGQSNVTPERQKMTLKQFLDALDAQRKAVLAYLESLPEADLQQRKARIPLFKQFMGTDEVPLHVYVGALFELHWNDHAGQLAKIRKAVGLPEAK
jgi:hypothetical protein